MLAIIGSMSSKTDQLKEKSRSYLHELCLSIPQRPVGSEGNLQATNLFEEMASPFGWELDSAPFPALDWKNQGAELTLEGKSYQVFPSPYSLGCSTEAGLVSAGNLLELQNIDAKGQLLLIHGDLAKEQLMPKNFVFYNPQEHQDIIALLEGKNPAAILTATGRNASLAGGVYPFPMIEDGDFHIPSVYLTEEEGRVLLSQVGKLGSLTSQAERIQTESFQWVARKGNDQRNRIIISAHIDAKLDTPGAIDNGTGVVILLLLAELFKDYQEGPMLELHPFNGEDYFAASGQMLFLEQNQDRFDEMLININIDGAGFHQGPSGFSPFNLKEPVKSKLDELLGNSENLIDGDPWYQGDHSIFIQQGVPAIAVSSAWFIDHVDSQQITHTPADHPDIVNHDRVVEIALAIQQFIQMAFLP